MKASLEPLADAPTFAARLQTESSEWHVEIETYRGVEKIVTRSAEQASAEFERRIWEMPRDLTFRAFHDDGELAWYGMAGVHIRLGADDRADLPYIAQTVTLCGPIHAGQQNVVTDAVQISMAGRVIYRVLRERREDERGSDQA